MIGNAVLKIIGNPTGIQKISVNKSIGNAVQLQHSRKGFMIDYFVYFHLYLQ